MNSVVRTVIVAPMTTVKRAYLTRVDAVFQKKRGQAAVDRIHAVHRHRLVRKLGTAPVKITQAVSSVLAACVPANKACAIPAGQA